MHHGLDAILSLDYQLSQWFRESGLRLELVVERGDHIVPSFQELHNTFSRLSIISMV
jgi:hypothetical protein